VGVLTNVPSIYRLKENDEESEKKNCVSEITVEYRHPPPPVFLPERQKRVNRAK
jgi:hypothetical protein